MQLNDISILTEAYQDRVQTVADAVEARSKTTPFTKEELLRAIESEAGYAGVAELKLKDSPRSTAWKDFVKDVLAALKGKIKFSRPGVAVAAAKRRFTKEELLRAIAEIIEDSTAHQFPDGDPIDYIWPRVQWLGIPESEITDWLDRAARKFLHSKSLNDFLAGVYDDIASDNLELVISSGAGLRNPYTNKPIRLIASGLEGLLRYPHLLIDILSASDIIRSLSNFKEFCEKHKSDILKSILGEIKRKPTSFQAKNAVRNLISIDIDWSELATIKKSIDPAQVAEGIMRLGDVLMLEGKSEAVVGEIISLENETIIIEGSVYEFNESEITENLNEAEYHGREVKLGKPMPGDVKKYRVYVKDPKTGNIKKVNFGDKGMEIKRDNPERRKSFRARHGCGTSRASDRTKAAYWSCRMWSSKPVSKILKGK